MNFLDSTGLEYFYNKLKEKFIISINSYTPDTNGNVSLTASKISTSDNTSIQTKINNIESNITDLNSDITDLNSDITDLNTDINNINSGITDLNSDITSLNTNVNNLDTRITGLNNDITGLNSDITDLTTNVNNLSTEVTGFADDIADLENKIPDFAVPTREWNHVTTQEEFETYLSKFNAGEVSWNCLFDAPGTYKLKLPNNSNRIVFTSIQAHWQATVDGVTLDLNGAVIYTSHIQITGLTKSLGDQYTFTIINTHPEETPYFEGCTLLINYCTISMLLRLWSCYTTVTSSRFTNDLNIPANNSSVDVIQGTFFSQNNYYDFDYTKITSTDFAIFGIGNSPKICLSGRIGIRDRATNNITVYLFRNRQNKNQFELDVYGSFYNIALAGGYNSSARRGHLTPANASDLGMVGNFSVAAALTSFDCLFLENSSLACDIRTMSSRSF